MSKTLGKANNSSSSIPEKRAAPTGSNESTTHSPAACFDCRSRKVKCNRQLPTCSNCKRSGVPCRFPNPEKKASQIKQLTEDVAQFNDRLSTMETSLVGEMKGLTDLFSHFIHGHSSRLTRTSNNKTSPGPSLELEDSDVEEEHLTDDAESPGFSHASRIGDRPTSVVVTDGRGERFYGACSTYSHMVHSKTLVQKLLNAGEQSEAIPALHQSDSAISWADNGFVQDKTAFNEVQRRYESFAGTAKFEETFETGDEKPLELPPRQVLDDAVEDYLSEYSLEPPLFDKHTLTAAIGRQYSADPSDIDEPWVLCFNNIILRSSAWKSRAFRFNSFAPNRVDASVLHSLLGNANKALRQLEKFCALRVVNIQALLLLAFVGRDLIHYNVFARIFDRVCQLAKQMGLHERQYPTENCSAEDREAQNVLWILYMVDKHSVFVRAPPCRIYKFECNLRPQSEDTAAQQLISTNLRLGCLIEEVYKLLYSPEAIKLTSAGRQQRVERLEGRLADLTRRVEGVAKAIEKGFMENVMESHLSYAFHVTRLLILGRSSNRNSREIRRETARSALQIIQSLSEGAFGLGGGVIVLERSARIYCYRCNVNEITNSYRLFCDYSVIAFHEIFEGLITEGPSSTSTMDVELLKSTTRALKMISHPDRPYSYCARLHRNFIWCTDIATLVSESRRSSPATPSDRQRHSINPSSNSPIHISRRCSSTVQQRSGANTSRFSPSRHSPSGDLGADIVMQDDMFGNTNMNAPIVPAASTAAATSLNARDASITATDFASLQGVLPQPYDYMFQPGTDDFDLTAGVMSNQFAPQPADLSPTLDNSARLQEALRYVLSMGNGNTLDPTGGYRQSMSDQVPPMFQYNRNLARSNN